MGPGGPGGAVVQGSRPLVGVQGVKPPEKKCILDPKMWNFMHVFHPEFEHFMHVFLLILKEKISYLLKLSKRLEAQ